MSEALPIKRDNPVLNRTTKALLDLQMYYSQ